MTTPKPTATPKPQTDLEKQLAALALTIPNATSKSTRPGYDNSTMFNISGLPLPSGAFPPGTTQMNGKDLAVAFEKMASGAVQSRSSELDWSTLKKLIADSGAYGAKPPSYKHGPMTNQDRVAINRFILTYAGSFSNPTPGQPIPSLWKLAGDNSLKATINGSGATRLRIANVTVPNTLDLNSISDTAFRNALGRAPTAKEQAKFASSYQQQVMAVAGSNAVNAAQVQQSNFDAMNGVKTPSVATPATVAPQMSTSTHPQTISAPTPEGNNLANLKAIPTQTSQASGTTLNFRQDTPNAQVAATNFALKADPGGAASNGVNNAIGTWFQQLKSGASNGL